MDAGKGSGEVPAYFWRIAQYKIFFSKITTMSEAFLPSRHCYVLYINALTYKMLQVPSSDLYVESRSNNLSVTAARALSSQFLSKAAGSGLGLTITCYTAYAHLVRAHKTKTGSGIGFPPPHFCTSAYTYIHTKK